MSKGKTYGYTIHLDNKCHSNCLPVVVRLGCFPPQFALSVGQEVHSKASRVVEIHPCAILDVRGILIGFTWEHTFDGCVEAISSLFSAARQHKQHGRSWNDSIRALGCHCFHGTHVEFARTGLEVCKYLRASRSRRLQG